MWTGYREHKYSYKWESEIPFEWNWPALCLIWSFVGEYNIRFVLIVFVRFYSNVEKDCWFLDVMPHWFNLHFWFASFGYYEANVRNEAISHNNTFYPGWVLCLLNAGCAHYYLLLFSLSPYFFRYLSIFLLVFVFSFPIFKVCFFFFCEMDCWICVSFGHQTIRKNFVHSIYWQIGCLVFYTWMLEIVSSLSLGVISFQKCVWMCE